jgi:hypothetical protein
LTSGLALGRFPAPQVFGCIELAPHGGLWPFLGNGSRPRQTLPIIPVVPDFPATMRAALGTQNGWPVHRSGL